MKENHIQLYVTIIGYDENGLMTYDSLQEKRKTIRETPLRRSPCMPATDITRTENF